MTAINHAMTGAVIGLSVAQPWLAVPVALVSHLVCDALPHFGRTKEWIDSRAFALYLVFDAALCGVLVLLLFLLQPEQWWLAAVCAFVAASPDFLSVRRFVAARRGQSFRPNKLERFLKNIQWFERPIGAVVEIAWFAAGLLLLSALI